MRHSATGTRARGPVCISISTGDRAGVLARRDALAEANLDLVRTIAKHVAASLPPSFDIEDLIGVGQLALLHAATAYRPGEHNGTPFSAFARKRIHGAMIDSIRRNKYTENTRPSIDDAPEVHTPAPDHVETIDEGRRRVEMRRAIARLDVRQREVMGLHYHEGMTLAAIAERMECSPSLVSAIHVAGLAALLADLDAIERPAA